MRDKIIDKLSKQNKKFYFLTGDLGFKTFDALKKKLKKMFINVGVAEQNMINVATGLTLSKYPVIVYSIVNFATFRCLEQIRNNIAYENLNVKIISNGAGYSYGALGFTHHGIEDIAIIKSLPNIIILTPTYIDQLNLINNYLLFSKRPIYLRLDNKFLNKDKTLNYKLNDKTKYVFISSGTITEKIEKFIRKEDLHETSSIIAPLNLKDLERIKSKKKNLRFFIIEEHKEDYGLTSEYTKIINKKFSNAKIYKLGLNIKDPHLIGNRDFLLKKNGLNEKKLFVFFRKNLI